MSQKTKERILDAAESLFAERGVDATSLRSITGAAGVNPAAIHYHFGSREALVQAIVERRITPLNRSRIAHLDELERAAGSSPVKLETILEAFLSPMLAARSQLGDRAHDFARLLARLRLEGQGDLQALQLESTRASRRRFAAALRRSCPQLSLEETLERLDYAAGSVIHVLSQHAREEPRHEASSEGERDADAAARNRVDRLLHFLAAGFRAPASLQNPNAPDAPKFEIEVCNE